MYDAFPTPLRSSAVVIPAVIRNDFSKTSNLALKSVVSAFHSWKSKYFPISITPVWSIHGIAFEIFFEASTISIPLNFFEFREFSTVVIKFSKFPTCNIALLVEPSLMYTSFSLFDTPGNNTISFADVRLKCCEPVKRK